MGETYTETTPSGWTITVWMSHYGLWSYRASKGGIYHSSSVGANNRNEAVNKVKAEIGA